MKRSSSQTCILLTIFLALDILLQGATPVAAERLPPRVIAQLGNHRFYHGPWIRSAVLSPDGRRAASAADCTLYASYLPLAEREAYARTIALWDTATSARLRTLHAPERAFTLTFAPDGKRLAVACEKSIVLFEVETGKQTKQWKTEGGGRPQFSADGQQLHLNGSKGVTSWSVASGQRIRQAKVPAGRDWLKEREHACEAMISPDGTFIAWCISEAPDYSKVPACVIPPPYSPRPTVLIVTEARADKPLYRREIPSGEIQSLSFSRDGKRFLIVAGDKTSVCSSATGKVLFTLDDTSVYRAALAADGRQAVLARGDSRVQLWDLESRKAAHELTRGLAYINSSTLDNPQCFSADGKWLLLSTDSTLRLFDTTTGKERGPSGHRAAILPWFLPDSSTLLTTCNEYRCRWRLAPGKEPTLLSREARSTWEGVCGNPALAHSAEGRLFVDARGHTIRLRETKTGKILHELENGPWSARVGQFSPDTSKLMLECYRLNRSENGISLDEKEVYRLFDTRTGKMSGQFTRGDEARSPVFSSNGRLVAWTNCANDVHLLDAGTGKSVRTLHSVHPLPREECNDAHLLFSPDSEYLAITSYKGHRVWEHEGRYRFPTRIFHVRTGKETARFHANAEKNEDAPRLSCWAWSPDNRLLAIAEEESGTIRLVEIASRKVREQLTGHRHGVRGLAFSPDGTMLASGGEDNVVLLWDVVGTQTSSPRKAASKQSLEKWWEELAGEDAQRAGDAIAAFLGSPRPSMAFFKERLHPLPAPDRKRLTQLIDELGSGTFAIRQEANRALEQLGEQAEAALRAALKRGQEPEVSRRIKRLLARLERGPSQEALRRLRAVETLEHLGTAEAFRCLEALAQGEPDAHQTIAAKEALRRRKAR